MRSSDSSRFMQLRNARISYECLENGNELLGLCASSNRSRRPRYSGPPLTMHSHPCALHQSRYTLRTFGRIRVTGNLRNPCFCAASKRIRSFCVSRWPMLRLPIFARVGMPRLSRSTSSLSGRVIVEIITSCAAPLKKLTDKLGFKNSIIKPST